MDRNSILKQVNNSRVQMYNGDIELFVKNSCSNIKTVCQAEGDVEVGEGPCFFNSDDVFRSCESDLCAYIINTSLRSEPGEHWVVLHEDRFDRRKTFFDSYGQTPTDLGITMLDKVKIDRYNPYVLQQSKSYICGEYICMYLYCIDKNLDYMNYLGLKPNDCINNDIKVHRWYLKANKLYLD